MPRDVPFCVALPLDVRAQALAGNTGSGFDQRADVFGNRVTGQPLADPCFAFPNHGCESNLVAGDGDRLFEGFRRHASNRKAVLDI